MKVQKLCHVFAALTLGGSSYAAEPAPAAHPVHDYPTVARVEYVNACLARTQDKLAGLYQCACAIDRIADSLAYDDYVEDSTFARYATLPGEGGGIFRDSDQARQSAKRYRDLESGALKACGMKI